MITIIEAHMVCYGPDDFGIMYTFSDGGIGGRSIGSFDEALQELNSINASTGRGGANTTSQKTSPSPKLPRPE